MRRPGDLPAVLRIVALSLVMATGCPLLAEFSEAAPLTAPQKPDPDPALAAARERALQTLLDDLGRQSPEVITIQRELVSRPAINPEHGGQGEDKKAIWLEERLKLKGFTSMLRMDYPDERVESKVRPNLIVRYPEKPQKNQRTLWLLAQLDTSPPGDLGEWKSSPFTLRVEGNIIHGSGVEENNQGITTSIMLLEALKKHSLAPPLGLGLVLTSGEQVNNKTGIDHVLEEMPDLFAPNDLFLLFDYGDKQGGSIEVAEKRYLWMKISVKGKQYFAGHPYRAVNPVTAGAALITALSGLEKEFPEEDEMFSHGRNFFTPTKVESSNVSINYIPGLFEFYLDARLLPSCDSEAVLRAIRRLADTVERERGVSIALHVEGMAPASRPTPADSPIIMGLSRAIEAQLGIKAKLEGRGGVTMATLLRHKGFPAAVWAIHERSDGIDTEHASISAHIRQLRVLARLLFDPELATPEP